MSMVTYCKGVVVGNNFMELILFTNRKRFFAEDVHSQSMVVMCTAICSQ